MILVKKFGITQSYKQNLQKSLNGIKMVLIIFDEVFLSKNLRCVINISKLI